MASLWNNNPTIFDVTLEELGRKRNPDASVAPQCKKYLQDVKNKRIANPFGDDEVLCHFIAQLYTHTDFPFVSVSRAVEHNAAFYRRLLPMGKQTADHEKILNLFYFLVSPAGAELYLNFEFELYALFVDKQAFVDMMQSILSRRNAMQYFPLYTQFLLNNRVNFDTERGFQAAAMEAIVKLDLIKSRAEAEEMLLRLTEDNRKRAGVHQIDEVLIQKLDDQIGGANSLQRRLGGATDAAQRTLEILDGKHKAVRAELETLGKNTVESFKTSLDSAVREMDHRSANAITAFETAYNEYLQVQKDDLSLERDRIVREIQSTYHQYEARLKAVSLDVSSKTSSELRRIQEEVASMGDTTVQQMQFLRDEVQLDKRIEAVEISTGLIDKVEEVSKKVEGITLEDIRRIKELLESGGAASPAAPVQDSANVIVPREDSMPTNTFLDKSVSYKKRFQVLMDRKKEAQNKGVLFHQLFDEFIALLLEDWNPYVWGPSGCGKTHMVKQAARLIGARFFDLGRINEPYELIGAGTITGGYTRPPFFQSYAGGGIAFADEIDASSPLATLTFNSFTANEYYIFPYYGRAERHPNFRLVAAGNTRGNGGDGGYLREQMDSSLMQRLTPIEFTYDDRVEKSIFTSTYSDWYEFSQMFRKATNEWARENHREAPGTFTTRDAARIKASLDNGSLTEANIIKFQFIENKEYPYLVNLRDKLNRLYSQKTFASDRLKLLFSQQVDEIGSNIV